MKLLAGVTAALLLALGLLVLAVRSDPDVPLTLTPAESDIPYCSNYDPVIVADLTTDTLPTCAPRGVELRFPDGAVLTLPDEPGSGAMSAGGHDYTYVDVGIFGMYASRADDACEHLEQWGTPEAVRRVTEAFGDNAACAPDLG
jgi:hypothetical protein